MITLDPEFVGSFDPSKSMVTPEGSLAAPFSRLSRADKLRVQGNLDETEEADDEPKDDDDEEDNKKPRNHKEKGKKMRGKNKSMKRSSLFRPVAPESAVLINFAIDI